MSKLPSLGIYIITYKRPDVIKKALNSIASSDMSNYFNAKVHVINNSPDIKIDHAQATIFNNLRNVNSLGYLARDYNFALMDAYDKYDYAITAQDDCFFRDDCFKDLNDLRSSYDFITRESGDCFCFYSKDHITKVGLWDERFCGLGYQEADYFTKSRLLNPTRTSINDYRHHRMHNTIKQDLIIRPEVEKDVTHIQSIKGPQHIYLALMFGKKWKFEALDWNKINFNSLQCSSPQPLFYPYFELRLNKNICYEQSCWPQGVN